jgi:hypothetical protein
MQKRIGIFRNNCLNLDFQDQLSELGFIGLKDYGIEYKIRYIPNPLIR